MVRLEKIKELHDLEVKKLVICEQLRAIKSDYFHTGTISFQLETTDFKYSESDQTTISFNKKLMVEYLETELKETEEHGKQILEKLTK